MKLYVDMDGTLVKWMPLAEIEGVPNIYRKGFFLNAEPQMNVVKAISLLCTTKIFDSIEILSAYLTDSKYALQEKRDWINKYLPEIEHTNFIPCGQSKDKFGIDEKGEFNILLDDYSKNLHEWSGVAIKLKNGINGNNGTWKGPQISIFKEGALASEPVTEIDILKELLSYTQQVQILNKAPFIIDVQHEVDKLKRKKVCDEYLHSRRETSSESRDKVFGR